MEAEQDSAGNNRRSSNHPLGLALDGSTASTSFVYRSLCGGAASHTTTASSTVPTSTYFPISRHHVYSSPRKLQLDLNPRYVSRNSYRTRIIHHPHTQQQQQQQPQQHGHVDANGPGSSGSCGGGSGSSYSHHRMRPYYVPERSRTKSENAVEACATVSQLFPELIGVQLATACVEDDDDDADGDENATIAVPQLQLALNHMMDTSNDAELMMSSTTNTTNSSSNDQQHHLQLMMKMPTSQTMLSKNKSRSLEDVCRGARSADLGSQPSHEMEFMSTWIQNLKVKD